MLASHIAILAGVILALGGVAVAGAQNSDKWLLGILLFASALLIYVGIHTKKTIESQSTLLQDESDREHDLETELEQQKLAIDTLAEGLSVAIFMADEKGIIQYANGRACELFRFESAIGKSILAVTISYDLEQMVIQTAADHQSRQGEFSTSYPEERILLAECWLGPPGSNVFLSVSDVTELRKMERIRQDFVANVSHEIRTPLASIRAMAETLQDNSDEDLRDRFFQKMISEVDRLSLITQDLLILSAAELNPVRQQDCDFSEIVRGVGQQVQARASEKGIELSFQHPPELHIEANPIQVTQVVLNLVENAINYTSEGSVTVTLSEEADTVVFQVKDTGIGIPSDHVSRVFERFYRVDKGRSRNTGGTGLGLSIVKHIVEAHGGTVTVESDLGKGSTFTVVMPKRFHTD